MNRRGFIGALSGLSLGVTQPRVGQPDIVTPGVTLDGEGWPIVNIVIHGPGRSLTARDRDELARIRADAASRSGQTLTVSISCDTREFQREAARAQRVIDAAARRCERALYRGIRVERA